MTNSLWVRSHILWKAVSPHLFLWPTGSEWDCTFCEMQSRMYISSYCQQLVSKIAYFVKGSLITFFPMTNSRWAPLHILWMTVSSHLVLWPTASKQDWTFCEGSLITSFPMTNRMWVSWFCENQMISSHLFLLPQQVSAHVGKRSLITSCPILWPTGTVCEWDCISCEGHSHYIISYDQQFVSEIAHSMKGNLITSLPMIDSEWVSLDILCKAVSSHFFLWLTGCEWDCTFCERQSHHIFSMTNSLWVRLHILWKAVSSDLFLWPTGCEWQQTFC